MDLELHKLAYLFMSIFTLDKGDFLHRSPGSDEFKIYSRLKTPQEIRLLLTKPSTLESHSEIPARIKQSDSYQSWTEFNKPYERLINEIYAMKLPSTLEQQTIGQVQITENIVETIVSRDPLTEAFDGLGANWYLDKKTVRSLALTDMLNMHEGNTRYGGAAIDQDLKRFSKMLLKHFPRTEGFSLFRSEQPPLL